MSELPFGFGILNQGELILNPEEYRLKAKRSWLFLHAYLIDNDELLKASRLTMPWSLEEDPDVLEALEKTRRLLARFSSPEAYTEYYRGVESHYDLPAVRNALEWLRNNERMVWLLDRVQACNPLTVLDVGAGYGEQAVTLARRGIQMTALNLSEENSAPMREFIKDESLPIDWITGVFETLDFKELKFDVVMAGEVIEHVADDLGFLQKCMTLAKDAVLVTTPVGSCEGGFYPRNVDRHVRTHPHVRAYSEKTFHALLNHLTGIKKQPKVERQISLAGYRNQPIYCFCAKLEVEPAIKESEIDVSDAARR